MVRELKIKITQKAYLLLALWADKPGKAMFLLHKIGNFFEKQDKEGIFTDWLVTSDTVCVSLFPLGFPGEESFLKWWNGQKISGGIIDANRVDIFPNEWKLK